MSASTAPHPPGSTRLESEDMSVEIDALRQMMAKLVEASQSGEPSLKDLALLVDRYSQASTRVARLLTSQRSLARQKNLGSALTQAIAEVLEHRPDSDRKTGL